MILVKCLARFLVVFVLSSVITVARADETAETKPIDIGSQRELFVDDHLVERLQGVSLKLHEPDPRDVVLVCDAPWEGNESNYYTFFRDDDRFRVYYRGLHYGEDKTAEHPQVTCYRESKDGLFRRWSEALIPITAPKDRDRNRSNYMTWGVVQLPGDDRELTVYATEAGNVGPGTRVRRFVFRIDGFVSAHADAAGTITTKTFTFTGSQLSLNVVSKGKTLVELQDADGKALPGFTLADCTPITADAIEHIVEWKGGDLAAHAGKPVRLRFIMTDADLYSIRFRE